MTRMVPETSQHPVFVVALQCDNLEVGFFAKSDDTLQTAATIRSTIYIVT